MKTSVIILTKNCCSTIGACLERVAGQCISGDLEVIVIDSGSTDGTLDIIRQFDVRLTEIPAQEFRHGRTRNFAASIATGDILAYLTQDALPLSSQWLASLTEPLLGNNEVAATYGRQIPREDASFNTRAALSKIYPDEPLVKRISDLPRLGLRAYHMTNATSAYRRKVLEEIRFREDLITCEDVAIAKEILEKGYAISYVPTAAVEHSHNYSMAQAFRRYFDNGASYQRLGLFHGDGKQGIGIVKLGLSHATAEARRALADGGIATFVNSTAINAAKYIGFTLGRVERTLPTWLKRLIHCRIWQERKPHPPRIIGNGVASGYYILKPLLHR